MTTLKLIVQHEWVLLTRNRLQWMILLLFAAAALYGIYYGCREINKQKATISYIRTQNYQEQKEYAQGLDADTSIPAGRQAYLKSAFPSMVRFYLYFYAYNEPAPLSKLSLGQRDIFPYYMQLNAYSRYLQLSKPEISNPRKLLAGNFDLAFILIYLLPLLIIAFTFNLLSAEKEQGTFALLQTHPVAISRIILYKLSFHFVLITMLAILLSLIGFAAAGTGAGFNVTGLLSWLLAVLVYSLFWFSLVFFIISFNRSTAFNAMWMLGLWIIFLIIIPSLVNSVSSSKYPVHAANLSGLLRSRSMGEKDEEMKTALFAFYRAYPAYGFSDTAKTIYFRFKAYSAFLKLVELEEKPVVDKYYTQIDQRNRMISQLNWLNPVVNAQSILNALGRTDLPDFLSFNAAVAAFREKVWLFSNNPLFNDRAMTKVDYQDMPRFNYMPVLKASQPVPFGLLKLFMATLLFFILAIYRFIKHSFSFTAKN